MTATNIFADLPAHLPDELITVLAEATGVRVERIVSPGHASPDGLWFDQEQHEWVVVLKGATRLECAKGVAVEGELWAVNDAVIDTVDFVEGVGRGLFKRVPVLLDTGETAEGYVATSPPYPYRSIGTRWE